VRGLAAVIWAAASLCALTPPAGADETSWQACACGPADWFEPANWTAGVPGAQVEAYVDNGGTAEIAGGGAAAAGLHVGSSSAGAVRQTDGASNFGWTLSLGYAPGSAGALEVEGGTVNAYDVMVGTRGEGSLSQTGGASYVQVLRAGADAGGDGTIALGGDGEIHCGFMTYVGHYGQGEFVQTGGTHEVLAGVVLGTHADAGGTYDMLAGVLRAAQLVVGAAGTGTLRLAPPADVALTDRLTLGVDGRMPADSQGTIRLAGGAMANLSTTPSNLPGLAGLTLVAEGGLEAKTLVEAAGEDRGAVAAGWNENFALGTLQLGGAAAGRAQLVNETANRPAGSCGEALYVHTLQLNPGAAVSTGGLPLYYLNGKEPKRFFLADANLDGTVGIADLSAVADHYGEREGVRWSTGDFNGDGEVGIADLSALADMYGSQTDAGTSVPEPAICALLAVGAIITRRRRCR